MHKHLILSDIHLEHADYRVEDTDNEKDITLILAGDIGVVSRNATCTNRYVRFLQDCSERFKNVILIAGNHEFYSGSINTVPGKIRDIITNNHLHNVHFLHSQDIVIGDIAYVGGTLWTDCEKGHPLATFYFAANMNDNKYIRNGTASQPFQHKFSAYAMMAYHHTMKTFFFDKIKEHRDSGKKVVVVSHHAPSVLSIHEQYIDDALNMFYYSELTDMIIETNPDLWVHGHIHDAKDYFVDPDQTLCQTRVVCNPKGYPGETVTGFQAHKTITL